MSAATDLRRANAGRLLLRSVIARRRATWTEQAAALVRLLLRLAMTTRRPDAGPRYGRAEW